MFGIRQLPSLLRTAAIDGTVGGVWGWNIAEKARESEPSRGGAGMALAGYGEAYNEEAFRFLLEVERDRFHRSNRPFALVLIEQEKNGSQAAEPMEPGVSEKVFAGLGSALRETDVLGWYHERHVVGAILTHLGEAPLADVSRVMPARITGVLRSHLPESVAERLCVRLYRPLDLLESSLL